MEKRQGSSGNSSGMMKQDQLSIMTKTFPHYRIPRQQKEPQLQSPQGDELLGICAHEDEILEAIEKFTVVIIDGYTGCGKSTKMPQFLYKKDPTCNIIVTQPKKYSAISLAKRVSEEVGCVLGDVVGYQVGGDSKRDKNKTRILYMTTEILKQTLDKNKSFDNITHILIDEIHERDFPIDLTCLLIKRMLETERNLKVKIIVMSATLSSKTKTLLDKYFYKEEQKIVKITSNSTHTVTTDWLDMIGLKPEKLAIIANRHNSTPCIPGEVNEAVVTILMGLDKQTKEDDDNVHYPVRPSVLVFLPGAKEIDQLEDRLLIKSEEQRWEICPLYSKLGYKRQHKATAEPKPGHRKIILATNMAESSITIPHAKYIIDFCVCKKPRMNSDKITTLELDWASKNECTQRKGRIGRVGNGKVFMMVTHEFYEATFRDDIIPEMQRLGLEQAVLTAKSWAKPSETPKTVLDNALSPPHKVAVASAIVMLKELGAFNVLKNGLYDKYDGDLTGIGDMMLHIQTDYRTTKMILLGHTFGLLKEAIVIGAATNLQHSPFKDYSTWNVDPFLSFVDFTRNGKSDMIALYNLYGVWYTKHRDTVSESVWAKSVHVKLRVLRDMDLNIESIEKKLEPFKQMLGVGYTSRNYKPLSKDDVTLLHVTFAGTFYPDFFRAFPTQLSDSRLNTDCYHVIYRDDFNPSKGRSKADYVKHFADILGYGNNRPSVTFDQRQRPIATFPGEKGVIPSAVRKYIRMRMIAERPTNLKRHKDEDLYTWKSPLEMNPSLTSTMKGLIRNLKIKEGPRNIKIDSDSRYSLWFGPSAESKVNDWYETHPPSQRPEWSVIAGRLRCVGDSLILADKVSVVPRALEIVSTVIFAPRVDTIVTTGKKKKSIGVCCGLGKCTKTNVSICEDREIDIIFNKYICKEDIDPIRKCRKMMMAMISNLSNRKESSIDLEIMQRELRKSVLALVTREPMQCVSNDDFDSDCSEDDNPPAPHSSIPHYDMEISSSENDDDRDNYDSVESPWPSTGTPIERIKASLDYLRHSLDRTKDEHCLFDIQGWLEKVNAYDALLCIMGPLVKQIQESIEPVNDNNGHLLYETVAVPKTNNSIFESIGILKFGKLGGSLGIRLLAAYEMKEDGVSEFIEKTVGISLRAFCKMLVSYTENIGDFWPAILVIISNALDKSIYLYTDIAKNFHFFPFGASSEREEIYLYQSGETFSPLIVQEKSRLPPTRSFYEGDGYSNLKPSLLPNPLYRKPDPVLITIEDDADESIPVPSTSNLNTHENERLATKRGVEELSSERQSLKRTCLSQDLVQSPNDHSYSRDPDDEKTSNIDPTHNIQSDEKDEIETIQTEVLESSGEVHPSTIDIPSSTDSDNEKCTIASHPSVSPIPISNEDPEQIQDSADQMCGVLGENVNATNEASTPEKVDPVDQTRCYCCNVDFDSEINKLLHDDSHPRQNTKCPICEHQFSKHQDYKKHVTTPGVCKGITKLEMSKELKCPCGKSFTTYQKLTLHRKRSKKNDCKLTPVTVQDILKSGKSSPNVLPHLGLISGLEAWNSFLSGDPNHTSTGLLMIGAMYKGNAESTIETAPTDAQRRAFSKYVGEENIPTEPCGMDFFPAKVLEEKDQKEIGEILLENTTLFLQKEKLDSLSGFFECNEPSSDKKLLYDHLGYADTENHRQILNKKLQNICFPEEAYALNMCYICRTSKPRHQCMYSHETDMKHRKKHRPGGKGLYYCKSCNQSFYNIQQLLDHKEEEHKIYS